MSIIIGNMKALNMQYDELWFVMRSMDWFYREKVGAKFPRYSDTKINKKNYQLLMQPNVHIVDELSPSHDLFTWYLTMKQKGAWNDRAFINTYVKIFLNDLVASQDAKDKLNELWTLDKQGKTVLLICVCQEEHLCHRSILAGILHGVGCNVISAFSTNISKYDIYYDLYRNAEKANDEVKTPFDDN